MNLGKIFKLNIFSNILFFSSDRYNYNSQAVPEPDEFNAVDFDPAKFVEQQTQCKQRQSLIVENNGTLKYTQTTTTITKPKRFRSDTNLLPNSEISPPTPPSSSSSSTPAAFPYFPSTTTPFPLWPFNLYQTSYFANMMNAIRLSSLTTPPIHEEKPRIKTSRKSFEIEGILNLSLRDNKRKNCSDTHSSDEEDNSI